MDDSVNHGSAIGGGEPLPESFGSDARAALLDDLKPLIDIHPIKTRRIRQKTAQELTLTVITFVPMLFLFPITEPLQITVSWQRSIFSKIITYSIIIVQRYIIILTIFS